ncbi:MAG: hypothetical protein GC162_05740 [Planctomycetes bacterium]|nr:hypothetical protein [Planctomycetota bacterium]
MSVHPIDRIMDEASRRLVDTDYLTCEQLCTEALALARAAGDFDRYARILMPLQEARRMRRQTAADAGVFVLTGKRLTAAQVLDEHRIGCLMLTDPPYRADDAQAIRRLARQRGLMVEVLVLDGPRLRQAFEQQMEREGDAALAAIDPHQPLVNQIDALAAALDEIGDHEIAHQRLAQLARQADRAAASSTQNG